jgi:DNA-binding CsgD family transcriptional regulator
MLAPMSSVATYERPTAVRLDYKNVAPRQLFIVIHALPTTNRAASAAFDHVPGPTAPSSPLTTEAERIIGAIGCSPALFASLLLAAWRGKEALALELTDTLIEAATPEDAGRATALTGYAKAVLYNGLGRYRDAVVDAQRVCAYEELGLRDWARFELVEAATRCGDPAVAAAALRELEERTAAGRDNSTLGVRARSAALLLEGTVAEALYCEAIERFRSGENVVHLARTQLVYGEWLRRENRRVDAREQLRAAYNAFSEVGAVAFAERATRELLATGETARRRTDDTRGALTPQEAQIARLARDGFSNPEIGAHLFISHRTVQYHLRKVFQKLEITSRNQLGRIPAHKFGLA